MAKFDGGSAHFLIQAMQQIASPPTFSYLTPQNKLAVFAIREGRYGKQSLRNFILRLLTLNL